MNNEFFRVVPETRSIKNKVSDMKVGKTCTNMCFLES